MDGNFTVNYHASIRIQGERAVFYIDPFKIDGSPHDADFIFITHPHYDHLSIDDIKRAMNGKTHFIAPMDCIDKLDGAGIALQGRYTAITEKSFHTDRKSVWLCFDGRGVKFDVFRAYNTNKTFHPKANNWVGYVIEIDGTTYAICGDTDITDELKRIKCDILFIPIGGTYTMTAAEAAEVANKINPRIAVPIHYNGIVGSKDDEKTFTANLNKGISRRIFV